MGSIVVLHSAHPLVGQMLPVVRRTGRRDARQWVIERPDGSRQYVPATWCTPLVPAQGDPSVPVLDPDPDRRPSSAARASPLTLSALRDLAALVRQLQEAEAQRGEQRRDGRPPSPRATRTRPGGIGHEPGATTEPADVGELLDRGSPATRASDPGRGPAPGEERPRARGAGAGEVSP